jgi:four helix bundle protein
MVLAKDFKELDVYQRAYQAALKIYQITKSFPAEEKYSLTDQVRRSSRSICANLAEAWKKRRYQAAFVAKLSDADAEAAETGVWLQMSKDLGYLAGPEATELLKEYGVISAQLNKMIDGSKSWSQVKE